MHNSEYNREIITKLEILNSSAQHVVIDSFYDNTVSLNLGDVDTGTQRVCIADNDTNLVAINSKLDTIVASGGVASHVVVDSLNNNTINLNSGNIDTGTQRVCIATNDVNLSNMNNNIGTSNSSLSDIKTYSQDSRDYLNAINGKSTSTDTYIHGIADGFDGMKVFPGGVSMVKVLTYGLGGAPLDLDTLISTTNTSISNSNTKLDTIISILSTISTTLTNTYNILNDVYDGTLHKLKVTAV